MVEPIVKAERAWCVVAPYAGRFLHLGTVAEKRRWAIGQMEDISSYPWRTLYRRGYRCVKVTVMKGWLYGDTRT
jgi:hypothetical protein